MLDETVETRRPWRGSPHPCVHAGVFLRFMCIISTVSKPLRYSRLGRVRVHPGARGLRPYAVDLSMYEYEYTCGFCLIYWGVRIILNIIKHNRGAGI